MNLILFDDSNVKSGSPDNGVIEFSDHRYKHIRDVLRAKVSDNLRLGFVGGKMGEGKLIELTDESAKIEVQLTIPPPAPLPLTLLLALPRPKFLAKILQTATSLGVKQIYLFNSYRVEKVYWSCDQLSPESIQKYCLLGLEQARDTILPQIHTRKLFKPFVEDEVPQLIKNTRALVAHPVAEAPCPYNLSEPITLAVGPEGGFIDYEVQKLESAGFQTIRLTSRILKVETALTTLIARLT